MKVKDIYKDSFICKVCEQLEVNTKDLAFKMNKTLKTIQNWTKDENSIPSIDKEYMKLLIENKQLENEIKKYHKHKLEINRFFESDVYGNCIVDIGAKGLKPKTTYKMILEEV